MSEYRRALEISPNRVSNLQNLAFALYEQGQAANAILVLQRAFEMAKAAGNESQAREIVKYLEMMGRGDASIPESPR
jgi:tetratricopeptide (TPR) repeat protein